MCRNLTIPPDIEAIWAKAGKEWTPGKIEMVQFWLNTEPQLHCMLLSTARYLGSVATAQDAEDVWSRFNWRVSPNKGVFSELCDKVIVKYNPEKGGFVSWLKSNLYLFCLDERKRLWRQIGREEPLDPEKRKLVDDSKEGNPHSKAEANDEKEIVQKCIEALSEKYRIVILMYYFENRSIAEIASELGLKENNVKIRLYRGRQDLDDCLEAT